MNEQTNTAPASTPSGSGASTSTPAAPATPSSPQTSAQLWESLEASAPSGGAAAPGEPETPPGGETPEGEVLESLEEPAAEAAAAGEKPEGEEGEAAKPEAPADWTQAAPPEKFTPEQKQWLDANPQIRDAVRRDRAYHESGISLPFARQLAEVGLTSQENVEQAIQSVQDMDAIDADFQAGTPEAALTMMSTLSQLYPEATTKFIENLTSPAVMARAAPKQFFRMRDQLLEDLMTNTRQHIRGVMGDDPDAVGTYDAFVSLLQELTRRVGVQPRGAAPNYSPDVMAKLEEYEAIKRDQGRSLDAQVEREVADGIGAKVDEALQRYAPKAFDPEVRGDLKAKILKTVKEQLSSQPFYLRGREAIRRDSAGTAEDRASRLIDYDLKAASALLERVAKTVVAPYTRNALTANQQLHEKRKAAAANREIGGSVPGRAAPPQVQRGMSNAQIWDVLETQAAGRGRT